MNEKEKASPEKKTEIVSQAHKDPYIWNIKTFQNFEKLNFYPNITKTGVIKNVDNHPINSHSQNNAAAYYQKMKDVPGPLLPEKNQNMKKLQIF